MNLVDRRGSTLPEDCRRATFTLRTLCDYVCWSCGGDPHIESLIKTALDHMQAEPLRHGCSIVYALSEDDLKRLDAIARSPEVLRAAVVSNRSSSISPSGNSQEQLAAQEEEEIQKSVAKLLDCITPDDDCGHFVEAILARKQGISRGQASQERLRRHWRNVEARQLMEHFTESMLGLDNLYDRQFVYYELERLQQDGDIPEFMIISFLDIAKSALDGANLAPLEEEMAHILRAGLNWLKEMHRTDNAARARESKRFDDFLREANRFAENRKAQKVGRSAT